MRVLVTGGAGFIGSNLCRRLVDTDGIDHVVALDDLSTGFADNLDRVDVEFVEGSFLDLDVLEKATGDVDAMVHLGARPSVPRSIADPVASHLANATGTVNVLESARRTDAYVVMASSSSVYGATPTLPKHEDLPTRPMSPYAASKLAAEAYTNAYELGHALGLDHGGDVGEPEDNCKPNYLSAMNYLFQFGIPDPTPAAPNVDTNNDGVADSRVRLDFSRQALPPLIESALNENLGIQDGTDQTVWTWNAGTGARSAPGNGAINWNNDTDSTGAPVIEDSVSVDINNFSNDPNKIERCNVAQLKTLNGFDDWSNLKYRAVLAAGGSFTPSPAEEIDVESARVVTQMLADAAAPDLAVSMAAAPTTVLTGHDVTFTATVRNISAMPADEVSVSFTLPTDVSAKSCSPSQGSCVGTTATLGKLAGQGSATVALTATVACEVLDGTALSASATAVAKPEDSEPSNNTASAGVTASNPPPVIKDLRSSLSSLWPANHKLEDVSLSYTVEDNCGTPTVGLSVASNQAVNGPGDGNTSPDWNVLSPTKVQLRAERAGNVRSDRIYTLTITATDSAGGSTSEAVPVVVPHNN